MHDMNQLAHTSNKGWKKLDKENKCGERNRWMFEIHTVQTTRSLNLLTQNIKKFEKDAITKFKSRHPKLLKDFRIVSSALLHNKGVCSEQLYHRDYKA